MKPRTNPTKSLGDENIIVFFPELITLLMGKDIAARLAFRDDVLRRAAEIRMGAANAKPSGDCGSKIEPFPMDYPHSA